MLTPPWSELQEGVDHSIARFDREQDQVAAAFQEANSRIDSFEASAARVFDTQDKIESVQATLQENAERHDAIIDKKIEDELTAFGKSFRGAAANLESVLQVCFPPLQSQQAGVGTRHSNHSRLTVPAPQTIDRKVDDSYGYLSKHLESSLDETDERVDAVVHQTGAASHCRLGHSCEPPFNRDSH